MIRHIAMWQIKDSIVKEERDSIKANVKKYIEDLKYTINGIVELSVETDCLEGSTADIMLNALFVDDVALDFYTKHNDHVKAAETYIVPYVKSKVFMDFVV